MPTMNMNPKNLLMLALLGIGAYFLVTRQAKAGTAGKQPGQVWSQSPAAANAPGAQSPITAGLNLVNSLFSGGTAPIIRDAGYTPAYTPDSAGESAARAYYTSNQDAFAVNPPTSYMSNDGSTGGTGGWLDSR